MTTVLFLVSANNGLAQRAALALRAAGHSVRTAVVTDADTMLQATAATDFDLIVAPYLKSRIPEQIHCRWPTIVIHPGPVGDRGPSSLDWAISGAEPRWGVTALGAVEEMDAGPIWATRTFTLPQMLRKSAVYGGVVADAAVECIFEAVAKHAEGDFAPVPLRHAERAIPHARLRPPMRQPDRAFTWSEPADAIARRIRAADGWPGVLSTIGNRPMHLYDAHPATPAETPVVAAPGTLLGTDRGGAVRVACGDGEESIWVGYLRQPGSDTCKGPAVDVLARAGVHPPAVESDPFGAHHEIRYTRAGTVGTLTLDIYNGAMSTSVCGRLVAALRHALAQPTTVLVIKSAATNPYWSNGIHLGVIELSPHPAAAGWANIKAINEVARTITLCRDHVIISGLAGNAGAGGVMLPLGADVVAARRGTVLNPHYATMGLYGSELHTYNLPRRVGAAEAERLLTDCLPISAAEALAMGLVDELGPHGDFDAWLAALADSASHRSEELLAEKNRRLDADLVYRPLESFEFAELGQMARDLFEDRHDFDRLRRRFICKLRGAASVPSRAHPSGSPDDLELAGRSAR